MRTSAIKAIYSLSLTAVLMFGCGTIQSHRLIDQPTDQTLSTAVGGTLFRMNKQSDLPNVFGKKDIYGGKIDRGYSEVKLVGIEDSVLVLDIIDVNRHSTETVMDRYKPFRQGGLVNVDVQQSINVGVDNVGAAPYRIRFDTRKQKDLTISGVNIAFIEVETYSVTYKLKNLMDDA